MISGPKLKLESICSSKPSKVDYWQPSWADERSLIGENESTTQFKCDTQIVNHSKILWELNSAGMTLNSGSSPMLDSTTENTSLSSSSIGESLGISTIIIRFKLMNTEWAKWGSAKEISSLQILTSQFDIFLFLMTSPTWTKPCMHSDLHPRNYTSRLKTAIIAKYTVVVVDVSNVAWFAMILRYLENDDV